MSHRESFRLRVVRSAVALRHPSVLSLSTQIGVASGPLVLLACLQGVVQCTHCVILELQKSFFQWRLAATAQFGSRYIAPMRIRCTLESSAWFGCQALKLGEKLFRRCECSIHSSMGFPIREPLVAHIWPASLDCGVYARSVSRILVDKQLGFTTGCGQWVCWL